MFNYPIHYIMSLLQTLPTIVPLSIVVLTVFLITCIFCFFVNQLLFMTSVCYMISLTCILDLNVVNQWHLIGCSCRCKGFLYVVVNRKLTLTFLSKCAIIFMFSLCKILSKIWWQMIFWIGSVRLFTNKSRTLVTSFEYNPHNQIVPSNSCRSYSNIY